MARSYEWFRRRGGRGSRWLGLVVAAALAGCSDHGPVQPATERMPAGLVVSEPLAGTENQRAGVDSQSAAAVPAQGQVYTSAEPGTFPDARRATVTNRATGESVTAEVVDGGFDPIALGGSPGDELEVLVVYADGATAIYHTTVPEIKRPRVVRTRPTRDAVDVSLNITILVVFSEPVDPGTVTLDNIAVRRDGVPIAATLTLDETGLRAELVPEQPLEPAATYTLGVADGIADLSGDGLVEPVTTTFTTEQAPRRVIVIVSGQSQQGKVGQPLDAPLVVRVTDGDGNAVPSFDVAWIAEPEGALQGRFDANGEPVSTTSTRTDADGITQVSFLPTSFGLVRVSACTAECGHYSVTFTTDTRDPDATLSVVSGNDQNAKAGQLAEPFVVRLTDGQGLPAPHVAVNWSITYGEGTLGDFDEHGNLVGYTRVRTDADGLAQASLMPTWFGPVEVTARLAFGTGGDPIFVVDATDAGAALTIVSGDGQVGKAGEPLAEPLVVRVTDGQGNPVANIRVEWTRTSGSGLSLGGDEPDPAWCCASPAVGSTPANGPRFSDSDGLAQARLWPWLGTSRVTAEAAGTHSRVAFTSESSVLVIAYHDLYGSPLFAWIPRCDVEWPPFPDECFVSRVSVPVGTTVEWVNYMPALHVASTAVPAGGTAFDSGTLTQNERFRFVPTVAGTWQYVDQYWKAKGVLVAY